MTNPMTLAEIAKNAYASAQTSGFYTGENPRDKVSVARHLAGLHAEVAEVFEDLRRPGPVLNRVFFDGDKPIGFLAELADVVIYAATIAEHVGGDIQAAVQAKMTYNATRGVRTDKETLS